MAVKFAVLTVCVPEVMAQFRDGQSERSRQADDCAVIAIPIYTLKLFVSPLIVFE